MRIAADLHDDVGASLSQIAVLSQYASRQAARGAPETGASLERITELAGSVVDAMSDVVWSINPSRDRMSDLVHRMRRFAVDLFSYGGTVLRLDLPENPSDERLDPEARRRRHHGLRRNYAFEGCVIARNVATTGLWSLSRDQREPWTTRHETRRSSQYGVTKIPSQ